MTEITRSPRRPAHHAETLRRRGWKPHGRRESHQHAAHALSDTKADHATPVRSGSDFPQARKLPFGALADPLRALRRSPISFIIAGFSGEWTFVSHEQHASHA
jgi:hypothetical protein